MRKKLLTLSAMLFCSLIFSQVYYTESSPSEVRSIEGGATWENSGDLIYNNNGTQGTKRALLYSTEAYQSDVGFRMTIEYTTGSIDDIEDHNFSFGLISDDTDLSTYEGFNPFREDESVHSFGINLTTNGDANARGLNFTDGARHITVDESGTNAQFEVGKSTKIFIEIGIGGFWSYRINDEYEASGVLLDGIDLSKNYHFAVYGQDDNGDGKSIQSISIEKQYEQGERAEKSRGTWASIDHDAVEQMKDFRTLDYLYARFNDGAIVSGNHFVPHRLLERLALEGVNGTDPPIDLVTPSWGNLNLDSPETDVVHDQMQSIIDAGFRVKIYSNSQQFNGNNNDAIEAFNVRWKEWCDTDPEAVAFVNSQPFHTGIWNSQTQQYEDATDTFPNRKYMFCYAEFVIKDYAIRYGDLIDTWIWDSAHDMGSNGDNPTSGLIEEQRIYQAYYNACHAGNSEIAIAFNNGRSTSEYFAYPFAAPKRFEDFTFGHAFGANLNHANKTPGSTFDRNYLHVQRMTETDGYVYDGGDNTWDDRIVGNFHSKIGSASWRYNGNIAWEQDDFNQWNLEAMQAGGAMTWSGATTRVNTTQLYPQAYDILKGLDDYLATHENPGPPQWARAETILEDAFMGEVYADTLVIDLDFWDPEGDAITVVAGEDAPSWLTITETESGGWALGGTPLVSEAALEELEFNLRLESGEYQTERMVNLKVLNPDAIPVTGITVSSRNVTIVVGDTLSLSAEVSPLRASDPSIVWSSDNADVATVDSEGLITTHLVGEALITATTVDGGFEAFTSVVVEFPNLALDGTASQSTTNFGGVAERAIDGNTDGTFGNSSVTLTRNSVNPWWQVDLGAEYNIGRINIFGRSDSCCANRLSDYTVYVIDSDGNTTFSENFTTFPEVATNAEGAVGQVIFVQLNTTGALALAEVQVYEYMSVTGIDVSPENVVLEVGDTTKLEATVYPVGADDSSVSWSSSDETVVTVTDEGEITIEGGGEAMVTVTTTEGGFATAAHIKVQAGFSGTSALPGVLEAEDYDLGGSNVGYYDVDAVNIGGTYRTDGVDIATTSDLNGGFNVTSIESGEWLAYTTDVLEAGDYYLSARVSTTIDTGSLSFLFDEMNVADVVNIPNTGGTWETIALKSPVSLTAGIQELRVLAVSGGFDLNYLEIIPVADECMGVADWTQGATYVKDDEVLYDGLRYAAKYYTMSTPNDNDWELLGYCGAAQPDCYDVPVWEATTTYDETGVIVSYQDNQYISLWSVNAGQEPGVASVWEYVGPCSSVSLDTPASPCPTDAYSWSNTIYREAGTYVTHNGNLYQNQWYANATDEPGIASVWRVERACTPEPEIPVCGEIEDWNAQVYPQPGTMIVYNGERYTNLWYAQANELPGVSAVWNYEGPCDQSVSLVTSLKNISKDSAVEEIDIKVYPNPFENLLMIYNSEISNYTEYSLFSINGIEVARGTLSNEITELDVSKLGLLKGVYLLTLKGEDAVKMIKVIKI